MMNNITFWDSSIKGHPNKLSSFNPFIRLRNFNKSSCISFSFSCSKLDGSNVSLTHRYSAFFKFRMWRKMNSFHIFIPRFMLLFISSIFKRTLFRTKLIFASLMRCTPIKFYIAFCAIYKISLAFAYNRAKYITLFESIRLYQKKLITFFTSCFNHAIIVHNNRIFVNGYDDTLVACQTLGVNAIGIEMNEEYCEIARKRLQVKPVEQFKLF